MGHWAIGVPPKWRNAANEAGLEEIAVGVYRINYIRIGPDGTISVASKKNMEHPQKISELAIQNKDMPLRDLNREARKR